MKVSRDNRTNKPRITPFLCCSKPKDHFLALSMEEHLGLFFFFFGLGFWIRFLCVIFCFKAGDIHSEFSVASSFLGFILPQDILGIQYALCDSWLFLPGEPEGGRNFK